MSSIVDEQDTAETDSFVIRAATLAPRPKSVADTGLTFTLLGDLIEKHLSDGGALTLAALGKRLALAGPILEDVLNFLRKEGRLEVRARAPGENGLRYALTERGRSSAQAAIARSGYVGPAPVPLDRYSEVVRRQTVHGRLITRDQLHAAFAEIVLDPATLDQFGPALNSGKAIFVYGHAGTGKTYITQRLTRLLDAAVLVPHSILVGESIIQIFDPGIHAEIDAAPLGALFDHGYDPRFVLCRRPLVITGGELSPDMLEVGLDPVTRQYRAPLQLQANNGMFILDDLGRQRVPPRTVLNRWIVPMEEGRDYLSLPTGQHFSVPFDLVLVFSTNMNPNELADEAFLRRIGYKIPFETLAENQYHGIWEQVCTQHGVQYDAQLCQTVINRLHRPAHIPLLPCHPRDLIDMALDHAAYLGTGDQLRFETLEWAWRNYFVQNNP